MFSHSPKSSGKRSATPAATAVKRIGGRTKAPPGQGKNIPARKSSGGLTVSNKISRQIDSSKGRGKNMEANTKTFMESRFGTSFDKVKIHNNKESVQLSRDLQAKAFTAGNDIYFNEGQYKPESTEGRRLLAHELAHVNQKRTEIRRQPMPKDAFGRPLGFVPTAEQEEYDRETYEIKEWQKTLDRLKNGQLDDRDLGNWRLMNRLTGLVTPDISALITKIQNYQQKNSAVVTSKITEWLEVRKQISTPMPAGAVVNKDPITQTIDSYSLTVNNISIEVKSDSFGNSGNETGPTTNFPSSYSYAANRQNIITRLINTENGANTPVNPKSLSIVIVTKYKDSPNSSSSYGRGTTTYDKEENTTTLRVHEGSHGTDYINYVRSHPLPVDISNGIVGVLTVNQLKMIDTYIQHITKESCETTDEVGFSQEDFLKTPDGIRSGIKNCRKP